LSLPRVRKSGHNFNGAIFPLITSGILRPSFERGYV
jgi:hypothetical protein